MLYGMIIDNTARLHKIVIKPNIVAPRTGRRGRRPQHDLRNALNCANNT